MKAWASARLHDLAERVESWTAAARARLAGPLGAARDWLCGRWPVCRWLDAAAEDTEPVRKRRRLWWALSLGGAFLSLFVLRQVDEILAAMHQPGEASFRIGSLSDVAFHLPSLDTAEAAVAGWIAGADPGVTGPLHLVFWYLAADVVFAFSYTAVAALALRSGQRIMESASVADASLRAARISVAKAGQALLVLLLAVDLLENLATGLLVPRLAGAWEPALGWLPAALPFYALAVCTALKWLLALLVLASLAAVATGALAVVRGRSATADREARGLTRSTLRGFWETLTTLRFQVAAVVVYGLFLLGPLGAEQLADLIRRWNTSEDVLVGVAAVVMTGWLSLVVYMVSWLALYRASTTERIAFSARYVVVLGLAGIVALVVGVVHDSLDGLAVGGGIALGVALLSTLQTDVGGVPAKPGRGGGFLPPLLTVLPLVLLGFAAMASGLGELLYAKRFEFVLLVVAGIALQALGWGVYVWIRPKFDPEASNLGRTLDAQTPATLKQQRRIAWASAAAAVVLCVVVWAAPWRSGDALGAVGVLAGFCVVLILVGYAAVRIEQRFHAPAFLAVLGFRRFPVFLLALLWLGIATQLDKGGFHDVRRIEYEPAPTAAAPGDGGAGPRIGSVQRKWAAWSRARGLQPGKPLAGRQEVVPLLLVASEGGGIRAAFWTADVLDCVIDHGADCTRERREGRPAPTGTIFAASGVSGGSLGLVAYVAHSSSGSDADDVRGDWVQDRLGEDFLTPAWSRMLFVDTPNAFLRLDPDDDRASMLEQAWERAWDDVSPNPLEQGLFALSWKKPNQPLLLLNGTSVQDGCRVNTSVLDAAIEGPPQAVLRLRDCRSIDPFESGTLREDREDWVFGATHDIRDFFCDEDVRLSTGALLSARFPYVTPAGRVEHCRNDDLAIFVVDGGYFDTSAASPIAELWAELEPQVESFNRETPGQCVVPFFLQIDNHYKEAKSPAEIRRPSELMVPITAVRQARDARENDARQTAALEFDGPFAQYARAELDGVAVKRYAHLYPRAHPGTKAPLGWALSDASIKDLRAQLFERFANTLELAEIRKWFDPDLQCVSADAPGSDATPAGR